MFSVKELFKIGHGPSSSHTIGPTRACKYILEKYEKVGIGYLEITLYCSFALTYKGHLLDRAVNEVFAKYPHKIIADTKTQTPHPNTMDVDVYDKKKKLIAHRRFVSIGGGTICISGEQIVKNVYPYKNFAEMKKIIKQKKLTPFQFLCQHEPKEELIKLYEEMIYAFEKTIKHGLSKMGKMSGIVAFDRRAKKVYDSISKSDSDFVKRIKTVSAYAMATNEEAVTYGLVVTAPTCGSAGVLPAVYKWAVDQFHPTKQQIYEALSAAALIGITIKQNGSVAGATGGCQAEVGVACCLAAAMYSVLAYHADIDEFEAAGEAALQHLIGLTCDAVGGCAYVPCIQRNAIYALRAINSAEIMHVLKDKRQLVKIDDTIKIAYETGNDLKADYRETGIGGLAKNCKYVLKYRTKVTND